MNLSSAMSLGERWMKEGKMSAAHGPGSEVWRHWKVHSDTALTFSFLPPAPGRVSLLTCVAQPSVQTN